MNPVLIALGGAALLVVLLIAFVISRLKVSGPNEAFIITGRKGRTSADLSGQKVVMGASVFVVPFVQRYASLDLTSRQLGISVPAAVSNNGIRCSLEAVAIVKVGGNENMIRAAAQRFLGQQSEIEAFTKEVLAGSLRAIVGRLSVEGIIRDRAAFAAAVAEEAEASLTNQGLVLDTFQLQDIQTEGTYLRDLGRPEAARAEKEAAIAEAAARRESEQARLRAEEEIAVANRELAIKQAEIKSQTDAAAANAAAAGPLAQAAKDQEVIGAQELVAQRKAALKERELDTEVRKPADAERYALEQHAEAEKNAAIFRAEASKQGTIANAEAKSEENRLIGLGERQRREELAKAVELEGRLQGEAEKARRALIADAVRAEGEAEASAIAAMGEAEAGAMQKKADAYEQYGDAAIADLLIKALPEVVRAGAEPISAVKQMTVISTDGASAVTRNVVSNVAQGMEMASTLTGVDFQSLFNRLASKAGPADGDGDGESAPKATTALQD
jgi:flotillin